MRPLILPALLMGFGLVCTLGGLILVVTQFLAPQQAAEFLPMTNTPAPPTSALLFRTPLAPPPLSAAAIPIMPVMGVSADIAPTMAASETPLTPTVRPIATDTRLNATPITPTRQTPLPQSASLTPSGIPFITPTQTPDLSPTPTRPPRIPDRLLIPAIALDAQIIPVWLQRVVIEGSVFSQWRVPGGGAAGWHETSAPLGQVGNTVLNGHHNQEGRVFQDLVKLVPGDELRLESADGFGLNYTVVQTMLLPEEDMPLETRLENARWILPSHDERITLVTCWPPEGRSHRLVVVALPSQQVMEIESENSHD